MSSYRGHDTEPPARSKGFAGLSISVRHGSDLADWPQVQTLAHGGPSPSAQFVQTRSVILIALLALVRKFIVLDLYQTEPTPPSQIKRELENRKGSR
jgi:hypothetical protein